MPTVTAPEEPSIEHVRAIVVGSGFGGAVAACRLAQAGFEPVILERGRRYEADDFPTLPNDSQLLPDLRRWTWGSEQGLWDILDLDELISVQAAGYGGGSLIYANVHLRAPKEVFDDQWPSAYQNGELGPFYDLVASTLDAAPIEAHPALARNLVKVDQLRQAAANLDRERAFFTPPLAVSRATGLNRQEREQHACTGCGSCCSGCPEKAKNSLDFNYLAIAEAKGARVRTQCEVIDIAQGERPGEPWLIHCMDHLHGHRRSYAAPYVFLCAGSVHSTRLLARAELREDPCGIQSRVGQHYYPGGDSVGVIYETEHPQYPSVGPTITTSTVHWEPDGRSFFMIQDGGYAAELERLIGLLRAPVWIGRNRVVRAEKEKPNPKVKASTGRTAPLRSARRPDRGDVQTGAPLSSPLDGVLDAIARGEAQGIVPGQLVLHFPAFLDELRDATLLPEVVGKVIDGAIRHSLKRSLLFGWWPEQSRLLRWVHRFIRFAIRSFFGTDKQLATRAIRAIATASDLGRSDVASRLLGYDARRAEHRMMLLGMGRDAAKGQLKYDKHTDELRADLDLDALGPGYSRQERLMADIATELRGELRTNPAWAYLGKPITVHNQGGCAMSDEPNNGVTDPDGKVHGFDGLYVLDGAALCTSVGANPAPTIAAIAERNIYRFLRAHLSKDDGFWKTYEKDQAHAAKWRRHADANQWALEPPRVPTTPFRSKPIGLSFEETMHGSYSRADASPERKDAVYRQHEGKGRPDSFVSVKLKLSASNLATFFSDTDHLMKVEGTIDFRLPNGERHQGRAEGDFRLPEGEVERFMEYELALVDLPGWRITGYKRLRDEPGIDAWRDTTTLFIEIFGPERDGAPPFHGAGAVHVDLVGFMDQVSTIKVTETEDPAQIVWAAMKFAIFFFGSLQRIYLPQIGSALDTLFRPSVRGSKNQ